MKEDSRRPVTTLGQSPSRSRRTVVARLYLAFLILSIPGLIGSAAWAGSVADPLTLTEAIELGLEHDSALREVEIELEIARLELDAELSSFFLPTVSLSFSPPDLTTAGWSGGFSGSVDAGLSLPIGSSSQITGRVNVAWDAATGSWSASGWNLSINQHLVIGQPETALDGVDRRRATVADAEEALLEAEASLIVNVARSFFATLVAGDTLKRAQASMDDLEESLLRTQEDYKAGLVGEASVLEARIAALDAGIAVEDRAESLAETQEVFFGETLGSTQLLDLVPPAFDVDRMLAAARLLLLDETAIDAAVAVADVVVDAAEALASAEAALTRSRLAIDPEVTIRAGLSEDGLTIGWSSSLTLFSPTWSEQIEIARLEVELASEHLRSARRQAESAIRSARAELKTAVRDVDRLPLEEERWTLEENVMRSKLDGGTISESDWSGFLDELESFRLDASERSSSLFIALIQYRQALGYPLEWEEWLG